MIADAATVLPLLRDPVDRSELEVEGDRLRSVTSGREYRRCMGQPVLVNFAGSLLSEQSFAGDGHAELVARPRHGAAARRIKALLSPEKASTVRNLEEMRALLQTREDPIVLVIGGGSAGQGTEGLYNDPRVRVIAFDIYPSAFTHFVSDAHDLPIASGSIDGVVIQAVLEHVVQPQRVVEEIWRVLKPGGLVYAETPFLQHVHEGAYDFTRFTESGHRYLFRDFALVRSGVSGGPGTQMAWSIDYLARGIFRSRRAGKMFKLMFFWLHWFDRIIPEAYSSDAASGFYFLGRRSEHRVSPQEIARFYRGAQRSDAG